MTTVETKFRDEKMEEKLTSIPRRSHVVVHADESWHREEGYRHDDLCREDGQGPDEIASVKDSLPSSE